MTLSAKSDNKKINGAEDKVMLSKSAKFSRAAESNEQGGSKDNVTLSGESEASDHHEESHAQDGITLSKSTKLLTGANSNKEGAA